MLLAHPTTCCSTLINTCKLVITHPTTPYPHGYTHARATYRDAYALLALEHILYIIGAPPTIKASFKPSPNIKVQIIEYTYYDDIFPC